MKWKTSDPMFDSFTSNRHFSISVDTLATAIDGWLWDLEFGLIGKECMIDKKKKQEQKEDLVDLLQQSIMVAKLKKEKI